MTMLYHLPIVTNGHGHTSWSVTDGITCLVQNHQFCNLNLFVFDHFATSVPDYTVVDPIQILSLWSPLLTEWDEVAQNSSEGIPYRKTRLYTVQKSENQLTNQPTPSPERVKKRSVNRSVIHYQLISPSTRYQSLVLCWWGVRRCCSGGVLASFQVYCSETPGKNTAPQW